MSLECVTAERYLREVWPVVTKALKEVGIGCELNLVRDPTEIETLVLSIDLRLLDDFP